MYYDGHFSDRITDKTNIGIMSRSSKLKGVSVAEDYCKAFQDSEPLSLKDFMKNGVGLLKNDYAAKFAEVIESINYFISQLVTADLLSNNLNDCHVSYPAIDRYNPLIHTDQNFETNCKDLFVIGDAAGVSRGYIQSLWSGWACGHQIVAQINNSEKYECITEMDAMIKYA
jgi:hypothetical protein